MKMWFASNQRHVAIPDLCLGSIISTVIRTCDRLEAGTLANLAAGELLTPRIYMVDL